MRPLLFFLSLAHFPGKTREQEERPSQPTALLYSDKRGFESKRLRITLFKRQGKKAIQVHKVPVGKKVTL